MRIKIPNGLVPLNLLVLVLIAAVWLFPSNGLRVVIGLPFLLFFPGYTLKEALFPGREGMSIVESLGLSFGMSIVVVPLIGFILNYTPWGIAVGPILYSTASFIFIMSLIAWFRRRKLAKERHFFIGFTLRMPDWGRITRDKVLSIILLLAILGTVGTLGHALAAPKIGERFTEFYILGAGGRATEYPKQLGVGQQGNVVVGIVNREHETVSYQVEVRVNGVKNNETGPIVLEHDEKWEQEVGFTPRIAGEQQKVEFLLFREGESQAYQGLHIWVKVIQ